MLWTRGKLKNPDLHGKCFVLPLRCINVPLFLVLVFQETSLTSMMLFRGTIWQMMLAERSVNGDHRAANRSRIRRIRPILVCEQLRGQFKRIRVRSCDKKPLQLYRRFRTSAEL